MLNRASDRIGDIPLGLDEQMARDQDDAFVRPATGRGRELFDPVCDMDADDGEIARFQFPKVRAIHERDGLCAVGMRIRAEPATEHGRWAGRCHGATLRDAARECKHKIPAIAGFLKAAFRYPADCGSPSFTSQTAGPGHSPLPQAGEIDAGAAGRTRRLESQIHRRSGAHGENHFRGRAGAHRQRT